VSAAIDCMAASAPWVMHFCFWNKCALLCMDIMCHVLGRGMTAATCVQSSNLLICADQKQTMRRRARGSILCWCT